MLDGGRLQRLVAIALEGLAQQREDAIAPDKVARQPVARALDRQWRDASHSWWSPPEDGGIRCVGRASRPSGYHTDSEGSACADVADLAGFRGERSISHCHFCRILGGTRGLPMLVVPLSRAAFACRRCDIPAWNASGATHLGESQPLDVPGDEGGQEEQ